MKVLLDTHTFLWWNTDDPLLSAHAKEIIADGQNEVFLSAASVWEIVIKTAKAGWFCQNRRPNIFPAV
jgi:PIN domain nuclease of toxin-antitoxin system